MIAVITWKFFSTINLLRKFSFVWFQRVNSFMTDDALTRRLERHFAPHSTARFLSGQVTHRLRTSSGLTRKAHSSLFPEPPVTDRTGYQRYFGCTSGRLFNNSRTRHVDDGVPRTRLLLAAIILNTPPGTRSINRCPARLPRGFAAGLSDRQLEQHRRRNDEQVDGSQPGSGFEAGNEHGKASYRLSIELHAGARRKRRQIFIAVKKARIPVNKKNPTLFPHRLFWLHPRSPDLNMTTITLCHALLGFSGQLILGWDWLFLLAVS